MGETQDLCKQINFNNLICYFKSNSNLKNFISFKGPLDFYRNMKYVIELQKHIIQHQKNQEKVKKKKIRSK